MKWYEKQKKMLYEKTESNDVAENNEKLDELEKKIFEGEESQKIEDMLILNSQLDDHLDEEEILTIERVIEKTVISEGTKMKGNIETEGDIIISGTVLGNITCSGTLEVDGEIEGDILCNCGMFTNTTIKGNITCKNGLTMQANTKINGDITASSMAVGGSVIGNIKVEGSLQLLKNAVIVGNVEAQYMESEKGSSLNGQCVIMPKDESIYR